MKQRKFFPVFVTESQLKNNFIWIVVSLIVSLAKATAMELSLSDCLTIANEKSVQAIQAVLSASYANAEYDEASRDLLPSFFMQTRMAYSNLGPNNLSDANRAVVRVEQRLNPFTPAWKKASQKYLLWEAANLRNVETKQDVALLVKQLYYSVLRHSEAIERLNRSEEVLLRLQKMVIPKSKVQNTPTFDMVKVNVAIADLDRNRRILTSEFKGDQSRLYQILGIVSAPNYHLRSVSSMPDLPEVTQYTSNIEKNPTLQVLSYNQDAAKVGVTAAQYGRMPDLLGGFDYGYGGPIGADGGMLGYEASIAIRIPLFDWGTISAQVNQQKLNVLLADNEREKEKQRIQSEIVETHSHATAQLADFKRLSEIIPYALRTALISIDRYKAGKVMILETAEAIDLWVQTLITERSAYYGYLGDLAKLSRLTGEEYVSK